MSLMYSRMNTIRSNQKVCKYSLTYSLDFPLDITVIFNFMMALSSMTNGETWTPICVPGCTEDYMLHVYISFKQLNLGVVLVCTDH